MRQRQHAAGAPCASDASARPASSLAACVQPRRQDANFAHKSPTASTSSICGSAANNRRCHNARAFAPRRQVGALRVLAGKAEPHRHDGEPSLVVEFLRASHPSNRASGRPSASVKGVPEACTLVPGAWLHTASRAVLLARSTGRGSCGSGLPCGASTQRRQARMAESTVSSSAVRAVSVIDRGSSRLGRADSARHRLSRHAPAWPPPYGSAARALHRAARNWRRSSRSRDGWAA